MPRPFTLDLGSKQIRVEGPRRLARVPPLCPMLFFLNLHGNQIGAEGKLILRVVWSGKLELLNLLLGEAGVEVYMFYEEEDSGGEEGVMIKEGIEVLDLSLWNTVPFSDVKSST